MRRAEVRSTSAEKMGARPLLQGSAGVTVARSRTELECLVPAWEDLARAALEPNPFYEHWMLLPALEAFAAGQELRVVLVWDGERLAGLFPFQRLARYKGLPAATLTSWRHPHCLLCTPLVRADCARACIEALLDHSGASLLELCYLPAGEPFHRALLEALAARGLRAHVGRSHRRGLLRKHRATISGQLRRKAGRSERRLREQGALAHVELAPQDDIARWIADFLALEAGGWKGRGGSAMASSPANQRYFTRIFEAAFRRGRLLACGLDLDGRAIARRASFTAADGAYAFKTAYDERFAQFSPGVMLELDNVRQVDANPRIQWMDSFTGDANLALERMWPDQREMHTLVAGVGGWGGVAAAALPWLRWIKRRIG
jgi:CelD/BcsL family acetyltransferase involved in cellulose biosynthesis